ncbi:MAG: hypothetical protein P1V97_29250 [Planctomycetota bacterium]|nr:hypothetical protein [Planctomycetota bacterium]
MSQDSPPSSPAEEQTEQEAPERLTIARFSIDALSDLLSRESEQRAMFELLARYYDGVSYEQFKRDLAEKQYVIRMFDKSGRIVGFSTIQLIHSEHQGRPIVTLFSGDTVIDKACWGQKTLQQAFVRFIIQLKLKKPWRRVYWFLITKGFKTYLLIRKNFQCHPNYEGPIPKEKQSILANVARLKYPDEFDEERGVIAFEECQGKVKQEFEDIGDEEQKNPDIAFFLKANPKYKEGEELCCLAEIRMRDLYFTSMKYFFWKPVQRLFRRK